MRPIIAESGGRINAKFGIGWTMNFARPTAWAIILGGLALTAAFVIAVGVLFRAPGDRHRNR